jgi:hypothetical protein
LVKYFTASGCEACGARVLLIMPARRGLTTKPSSASFSASLKSVFQAALPCSFWAWDSMATAPGTPDERPDSTAVTKGRGLPSWPMNMSGEAPLGAVSRPS